MKILLSLRDDALLAISSVMITGAGVYYFYALNWPGIILTLMLSAVAFVCLRRRFQGAGASDSSDLKEAGGRRMNKKSYLLIAAYLLVFLAALAALYAGRSDRALITPWAVVPPLFFWLYAAASLLLVFLLTDQKLRIGWKLAGLSAHYLLSAAVAAIIYKIGYGYDPFIHEAAMKLIAAKGLVLPKPPYYLGEYSLIVIIHQLSGLSIAFLSKLLLPALAALFLPAAFYRFLKLDDGRPSEAKDGGAIGLTVLFLLGLTFSPFILTTPQNLSYLFLILTVLAGCRGDGLWRSWILAIATAAIHPLTGLPALAFAAAVSFWNHKNRWKEKTRLLIKSGLFLFAALALPFTLFFAAGGGNHFGNASLWSSGSAWLASLGTAGREDWLSNVIYFFDYNYGLIICLALGGALWHYRKRRSEIGDSILKLILPALIVAYLLSSQINFGDLISYEQADYADRLPIIMLIFLLPFLLSAGRDLIAKIRTAELPVQILWLAGGLALMNISLYLSYPRFDKYWNSRGYSTSQNDIRAVKSVADAAAAQPYIALANQQVSAAALREFGFDHYYDSTAGPLFFYPIPTGGPLYQHYLDMVYKAPDKKTMAEAMALAGVERGYLIVNKYWYRSDRIIAAAKLAADRWWAVDNDVYIFEYLTRY